MQPNNDLGGEQPETNLYQKDFKGTSNVYAPYIYKKAKSSESSKSSKSSESFDPSNLYDDKYSKYS